MSVKSYSSVAALAAVTSLAVPSALASITIPTMPVGNPGNAADTRVMNDGTTGYGSVAYTYNIGSTEVTNAQYVAFLNAVAATDTYGLYNPAMSGSSGGIARAGSPGSYVYAPITGRANNPVNFVSFWDACRFSNWLHNGQPTGPQNASTTEDGAYTLGGVANPVNASISRNAGWQWAVPSENEWYKAAYHQPASAGGPASNYWLYPTSSNTLPAAGLPPVLGFTGQANYSNAIGLFDVGGYAPNFYGVYDMGGNLFEWNEAVIQSFSLSTRGVRGGSFASAGTELQADSRRSNIPTQESAGLGFRVVQVPGPSSVALLAIGGLGALRRRRGR